MLVTVPESEWRTRAACLGLHDELFFAPGNSQAAINVCHACPVIAPCRADALNDPQTEQVGIRGGLYACQRVAILRGRRLYGTRP